ncbi:MAG TPA: KpsF/GutQ family sugar-phosphate isomerase [Magnetospirillaceae bacterium]|jgi:arabinose-5-phosphate isomerase
MDTTRANTARNQTDTDLAVARQVLRTEASALEDLARALNDTLPRALDILTRDGGGRVIVTGMGKSGHIGRKIAATLASTGTPAQYVHPGEASHGDMGMITAHDAILALSNSGETAELSDVIDYSRRFAIPLVVVTARANSALAQAGDLTLLLPEAAEACPHGLTPTTSTTMMLALGDALAVALLERRGFSADDFKTFHPGGKLGRKLLHVADLMHDGDALPLIDIDRAMSEALIIMSAKRFGCVGALDTAGRLAGIVTDGDLRRHMEPGLTERPVREIMTANPRTVRATTLAGEALRVMNERGITTLFVVDEDRRPSGILHVHDLLRAGVV